MEGRRDRARGPDQDPHGEDDGLRYDIPLGSGTIPMTVVRTARGSRTVILGYDAFVELWSSLLAVLKALEEAGVDPDQIPDDAYLPRFTIASPP